MTITLQVNDLDFNNNTRRIYKYDSTSDTYTQLTSSTTMSYFETTSVAGDSILFMNDYRVPFAGQLTFNVGTPINATDLVLKWYVGSKNSKQTGTAYPVLDWVEIAPGDITDETNGFTTLGVKKVIFSADVIKKAMLGRTGPLPDNTAAHRNWWVKCEIDSVTSITDGGANTTDQVKFGYNECRITGSYDERTVHSYSGNTVINAPSGTLTTDEYMGRAIWIPEHDNAWNKFPIRSNTAMGVVIGIPTPLSASSNLCRLNPNELPEVGQTMVISHTMEDVAEACITAGLDWVKGENWHIPRQEHLNYEIVCDIILDGGGTDYSFLSGFSQSYRLYGGNFMRIASVIEANLPFTKFMFGVQAPTPDKDGVWSLTNGIVAMGCMIDYIVYRNQRTNNISGDYNGTIINGGVCTSFQTTIQPYDCNIFNSTFGFCQLGVGRRTRGRLLLHSPVAEPLRDPESTFKVSEFRAGWGPFIYTVGAGNYVLDSPASTDTYGLTSWTSFSEVSSASIIDKNTDSSFACRFVVLAGNTSGTVKFYFRTNVHVRGSGEDVNPIANANITLYDKNGDIVFSDTTDADGNATGNGDVGDDSNKLLYGTVKSINDTASTQTEIKTELDEIYGPFVLKVDKAGYETALLPFVGDKRNDFVIEMKKAIDVMPILGKGMGIRADPTNSTKDRDILLPL